MAESPARTPAVMPCSAGYAGDTIGMLRYTGASSAAGVTATVSAMLCAPSSVRSV